MNLIDVEKGYVTFVVKYGKGRYQYNFRLLEELVKQSIITPEQAQMAIDDWMENHKYLSQNEDIVSYGMYVNNVDTAGSLDIMAFKETLETEIMLGLFQ